MVVFNHFLFWSVIIAGAGTQFVKILFFVFKHHQGFRWADLFVTGSMPSSHSAFVVALTTAIFLQDGVSTGFIISLVLAAITIRDALGVRRSVGEEGKVIDMLIKRSKLKIPKFHYALGHKPEEVLVGSVIGFVIPLIMFFYGFI